MNPVLEQTLRQDIEQYKQAHDSGHFTAQDAQARKERCIQTLRAGMQELDRDDAEYKQLDFLTKALANGWLVSDIDALKGLYQNVQKLPDGQRKDDGNMFLQQIANLNMDTLVDRYEMMLRLINYASETRSFAPQELRTELSATMLALFDFRNKRIYPAEYPNDRNFAATAALNNAEDGVVYSELANDEMRSRQYRQAVLNRQRSISDYVIEEQSEKTAEEIRRTPAAISSGQRLFGGITKKTSRSIIEAFGAGVYDEIEAMHRGSIEERRVALHHSLGTKYQKQGHDVLEMEFAGSGGQDVIRSHKERRGAINLKDKSQQDILDTYGTKAQKPKGSGSFDYIWKKERTLNLPNNQTAQKVRYTFAGASPTMLWGLPNFGNYSIQSSRDNASFFAAEFLKTRFDSWLNGTPPKPLHIELSGHSRGAVTAGQALKAIDKWVTDYINKHPGAEKFKDFVNYDLILRDPVPGLGTDMTVGDCDLRNIPNVNATVFCSMGIQVADTIFPLEHIRGAKKLILNTERHEMELSETDRSQNNVAGNNTAGHMVSYYDSETGEMHRGSGLSELPDGIYVADEKYKLIRVTSYSQVLELYKSVFEKSTPQATRSRRIHKMVRDWFCENELEMSFPDERTYKAEAAKNKCIEDKLLGTKDGSLNAIQRHIEGMQRMRAEPHMPKEAFVEMNKVLIGACREYLKNTKMPPAGDSAYKAGLIGDLMSFAMRENNQIAKDLHLVPANDPRAVLDAKILAQRDRLEHKAGYLERKQAMEGIRLKQEKELRTMIQNTQRFCKENLDVLTKLGVWKSKNRNLKNALTEGLQLGDHTSVRELKDFFKRFTNAAKSEAYTELTRFGTDSEKALKTNPASMGDPDIGIGTRIENREAGLAYLKNRQRELANPQNQRVEAAQPQPGLV